MLRVRVARPPPGRAAIGLLAVVRLLRGFRGSGLSGVTGACPSRAADLASAQQQATHLQQCKRKAGPGSHRCGWPCSKRY
jgi:hypothetical protein